MRRSILLFIVAIFATGSVSSADVLNVPDEYPTIQAAIDAAGSGDIVLVAEGEYPEEITLKSGVIVQGAGEGLSIINGGGDAGDVVTAVGNDIDNDTKLLGFTITGAISGGSMPGGGGVFCNSGASPTPRIRRPTTPPPTGSTRISCATAATSRSTTSGSTRSSRCQWPARISPKRQ